MRTTLNIGDDVLEAARAMAKSRRISVGAAISILCRWGMGEIGLRRSESGLLVFDVPDWYPHIGAEDVRRGLADFP